MTEALPVQNPHPQPRRLQQRVQGLGFYGFGSQGVQRSGGGRLVGFSGGPLASSSLRLLAPLSGFRPSPPTAVESPVLF